MNPSDTNKSSSTDRRRRAKRPSLPMRGEGWSNDEIFAWTGNTMRLLQIEMKNRRNRDRASVLLTDMHLGIAALGYRLAETLAHFDEMRPSIADEEDAPSAEERSIPMSELFAAPAMADEEALAEELGTTPMDVRVRLFRNLLEYMTRGCRDVDQITRKVIAFTRRLRPDFLKVFGMSQVAVSRKLGEQRATTSAREKRLVEGPLKANGTRGFLLAGGQKKQGHRDACREAQIGNGNRRGHEERKRVARGQHRDSETRSE